MSTPADTLTSGQQHEAADPHTPAVGCFTAAAAAELTGLRPQTLRLYERRGLIEPARSPGGQRLYRQADIDRLRHIAELSGQGGLYARLAALQFDRAAE